METIQGLSRTEAMAARPEYQWTMLECQELVVPKERLQEKIPAQFVVEQQ